MSGRDDPGKQGGSREYSQEYLDKQWKPGQSGNPSGRTKGVSLVQALKASLLEAEKQADAGVDHERRDPTIRELASHWLKLAKCGDPIAMAALDKLADRLDGKAKQRIEHTGADGEAIKIAASDVRAKLEAIAGSVADEAAERESGDSESDG